MFTRCSAHQRLLHRLTPAMLLILFAVPAAPAQPGSASDDAASQTETVETDRKDEPKTFEDVIDGTEKIEGLITVYRSDEHLYFELPAEFLADDYGLSVQVVGAIGDWRARGSEVGSDVVRFERLGDHIRLVKRNVLFRADEDAVIRPAVDATFPDSPVMIAEIVTTNPENRAVLADFRELFSASTYELLSSRSKFKPEGDPIFLEFYDHPENVTVQLAFHFNRSPEADGGEHQHDRRRSDDVARLPDPRNIELTVQFDLFRLPNAGYRPRVADDRLGVWAHTFKDYTDIHDRDTAFRQLATRWDVRKLDPKAAVSPPVEPIVFYIDRSVPPEVRPLVRAGATWWNDAFEEIGITGAIEVRDQPLGADWHPTDIRYSMIYWNLSDDLNFSGMAGPQIVDPMSGQVLKANVYLNAEFLSFTRYRYLVYSWWRAPGVGALERGGFEAFDDGGGEAWRRWAALREELGHSRGRLCDYAASFSSQLAFARLVLQARGVLERGSSEEQRYSRQAFTQLVAHEVGHALGIGHNFKASRLKSYDDLVSGAAGDQLSGSIMDYHPINLPPSGKPVGPYLMSGVGEYDRLMIEYLYRPLDDLTPVQEAAALEAIAARAETKPGLAFDSGLLSDADPTSNTDDLGDDPLRFAEDRLAMVAEILPRLPELVLAEGHQYNIIQQALDSAVISVAMDYFDIAARHIGGREILRVHHQRGQTATTRAVTDTTAAPAGATEQRLPITPIPATTQRRALDLVDRRLFADGAFVVSRDFLNALQTDLQRDWNYPHRYGRDYLYETRLAYLYGTTLGTLLAPKRLARVKDNEARFGPGEERFALPELFERLTEMVFRGLEDGNFSTSRDTPPLVASKRRALHRIYTGMLADLVLKPGDGMPPDASVLARSQLDSIRQRAKNAAEDGALLAKLDGYGRAHLADLDRRIELVLDAEIALPPDWR